MSIFQSPRGASSKMSSLSSIFVVLREESWRPALRQYRRKILGHKNQNDEKVEGEKFVIVGSNSPLHEKADLGVAVAAVLPDIVSEPVDQSSASKDFTVHSALRVIRKGTYELSHSIPMPEFEGDEVMVQNHAAGLNPVDWKSVDYNSCLPSSPGYLALYSPP
jgi:hypothetical protein